MLSSPTKKGPHCDVCWGRVDLLPGTPRVPVLLRRFLGVIVCGEISWCKACRQLLQLWEDFSSKARSNLANGNHKLLSREPKHLVGDLQKNLVSNKNNDCEDIIDITDLAGTSSEQPIKTGGSSSVPTLNPGNPPVANKALQHQSSSPYYLWEPVGHPQQRIEVVTLEKYATHCQPSVDPLELGIKIEPSVEEQHNVMANQLLNCMKCSRQFCSPIALRLHTKYRHGIVLDPNTLQPSKFKCQVCSQNFLKQDEFDKHCLSHLRNSNLKMMTVIDIDTENANSNTFLCNLCKKAFRSRIQLVTHFNQHKSQLAQNSKSMPNGKKIFTSVTCKKCDANFSSRSQHMMHMWNEHKNILLSKPSSRPKSKPKPLPITEKKRRGRPRKITQNPPKPIPSPVSLTLTDDADDMTNISGPQYFCCKTCDEIFLSPLSLEQHIQELHSMQKAKSKPGSSVSCANITCMYCDVQLSSKEMLEQHLAVVHDLQQKQSPSHVSESSSCVEISDDEMDDTPLAHRVEKHQTSASKDSDCSDYGEEVNDEFKKHYTQRSGMYYCNFCLRSYKTATPMIKHLMIHLPGASQRRFTCNECKRGFSSKAELFHHQKNHKSKRMTASSTTLMSSSS